MVSLPPQCVVKPVLCLVLSDSAAAACPGVSVGLVDPLDTELVLEELALEELCVQVEIRPYAHFRIHTLSSTHRVYFTQT